MLTWLFVGKNNVAKTSPLPLWIQAFSTASWICCAKLSLPVTSLLSVLHQEERISLLTGVSQCSCKPSVLSLQRSEKVLHIPLTPLLLFLPRGSHWSRCSWALHLISYWHMLSVCHCKDEQSYFWYFLDNA